MLAVRSFITHSQKKAVADAQEKRDIQELKERVDKLEKKTFPDSSYQTWIYDANGNITGLRTAAVTRPRNSP